METAKTNLEECAHRSRGRDLRSLVTDSTSSGNLDGVVKQFPAHTLRHIANLQEISTFFEILKILKSALKICMQTFEIRSC